MSDKKNEDFVVRMPDTDLRNSFGEEKDPFLGRSASQRPRAPQGLTASLSRINNSPGVSVLAYCLSSISMTVVNKYVVSGDEWNLNFFYLAVQVRDPSSSPFPSGLGLRES